MSDLLHYKLSVELLEDLHTGTGTGAGDIDALQLRDRNGMPVIRASHFKGLLRVAAEELVNLKALDQDAIKSLLGSGGGKRGTLRLTSLRLKDGEGKTVIWTSSARKENERGAAENTMRIIEHTAAGNCFSADLRFPKNQEALMLQLIKRIDRIGSDRNRGGGLVKILLEKSLPAPSKEISITSNRLLLRLKNLEPLCLPYTGHPGNLIESHAFIRGQVLRGALMAWALAQNNTVAIEVLKKASVGDALPLPKDLEGVDDIKTIEVMPIPLSILTPKPSGGAKDIPWWAASSAENAENSAYDDLGVKQELPEKAKRPGAREFLASQHDSSWIRYSPSMGVHMRNQTADSFIEGAEENETPQLFSMEEIAEETCFLSELTFSTSEDAKSFALHFAPILFQSEWLAIGREGRPVQVEVVTSLLPHPSSSYVDSWTLTLTSDTILRGEYLGFLNSLDPSILSKISGVEVPKNSNWQMKGFSETQPIQGFNAASGLRRAAAIAIRRGSCWLIKGAGSKNVAEALAKLPHIGERADEGYGRFVINAQPITKINKPSKKQVTQNLNAQERLLKRVQMFSEKEGVKAPSLSQLQWFRGQALACNTEKELQEVFENLIRASEKIGGQEWGSFPLESLQQELQREQEVQNKRLFISLLVQKIAPVIKKRDESKKQENAA